MSAFLGSSVHALQFKPECDPKDATSCTQILLEGEQAPFKGALLTFKRAAKLGVSKEQCLIKLGMAVSECQELSDTKAALYEALRASEKESFDQRIKLLMERLKEAKEAQKVPWYQRPTFVVPTTVIVTGAIFWAAIEAIEATRPVPQ